jgi:Zn-finger nucleic acid-binding protein
MMSERQGVEIDYCPKCRGVWLDRGELDKLIERSQSVPPETYREESYSRGSREAKGCSMGSGTGDLECLP